jgi:hypothetical protein
MTFSTQSSSVPELPFSVGDNCKFTFIGEGAANFVFEVLVPPSDEPRKNPCDGADPVSSPSRTRPSDVQP